MLPDSVSEGTQATTNSTISIAASQPGNTGLEVSLSRSSCTVNEGDDATIKVEVSPAADRNFEVPVTVQRATAESGDYSTSGLTGGKLAFASGNGSATFTKGDPSTSSGQAPSAQERTGNESGQAPSASSGQAPIRQAHKEAGSFGKRDPWEWTGQSHLDFGNATVFFKLRTGSFGKLTSPIRTNRERIRNEYEASHCGALLQ